MNNLKNFNAPLGQVAENYFSSSSQTQIMLNRFCEIVERRLNTYKKKINLLTYEGTILDQLAYYFISKYWDLKTYEIICSTRPCMHPRLVKEVTDFALKHKLIIASFKGDCSARYPWLKDVPRSCENIGEIIYQKLSYTNGLLLSSGMINSKTQSGFNQTNKDFGSLYAFQEDGFATYQKTSDDRSWNILFLFLGFSPEEIVMAYHHFINKKMDPAHVPICYLECYNENEQRKLLRLINTN